MPNIRCIALRELNNQLVYPKIQIIGYTHVRLVHHKSPFDNHITSQFFNFYPGVCNIFNVLYV